MTTDTELFLITGATGKTGAHTVRLLMEHGHRVRALVHTVDERASRLAEHGAEIVAGDLLDFSAVSSAMRGVTAAYLCYPITPGLVDVTAIFAQAASEAGVHAVVNMSQISARREAKSDSARAHWICERMLDRTALVTTHLRPTFFTNWQYDFWVRQVNEGIYRLPFGDVRHAPIDAADQARVIAAILQNPGPHDRQIYPLYGDKELNYYEIAAKVQETLGIPVRYEPIDIPTFAAGLVSAGVSPFRVQHVSSVAQDYLDGVFSGTNNLVEVIGGTKPRTIEDSVAATRSLFETDGIYGITDERLSRAQQGHMPIVA
jgi:NAD(P)H dehydrogenase (quinone)